MNFNIVDLFAGCGGLTDGFLQTKRFHTLASVDWELPAVKTLRKRLIDKYSYSKNEVEMKILHFDIQRIDELLNGYSDDLFGNSQGFRRLIGKQTVDMIVGGPPCQAYSIAGRVRDKNGMKDDYRNYLFESYVHVVAEFKPKYFVFENVEGILSAKPGDIKITERIKKSFKEIGYLIPENLKETALFDLSYYGVPQKRKRIIIFGVREEYGMNTIELFYNKLNSKKNKTTTKSKEVFSKLPKLIPLKNPKNKRISHIAIKKHKLKNHEPRFHNQRDIQIFNTLTKDIENAVFKYSSTEALKNLYEEQTGKKSNFHKYNVIKKNAPSNTIPAHLYKDGLRHIHPDSDQSRTITVREAAKLQSFDDDFEFLGTKGDQYKMVGNAVPPKFSKLIAKTIIEINES